MRWTLYLGKVFQIKIRVHVTFLLLIAFVVAEAYHRGVGPTGAMLGVGGILLVFGSVILHELGPALTGRLFGVEVVDITLLPIGGLARMVSLPKAPMEEVLIAVAGPIVSLLLAGLALGGMALAGGFGDWPNSPEELIVMPLAGLFLVNVMLGIFNLLPAFPMDGGRILRGLMALFLPHVTATRIAAKLGQGLALLLVVFGLYANPWLSLIGVFIFFGAMAEERATIFRHRLQDVSVLEVMATRFRFVSPTETIDEVRPLLYQSQQKDFPVAVGDRLVGLLLGSSIVDGEGLVSDQMITVYPVVAPGDGVLNAHAIMSKEKLPLLPVYEGERFAGIVSMDQIFAFDRLMSARGS